MKLTFKLEQWLKFEFNLSRIMSMRRCNHADVNRPISLHKRLNNLLVKLFALKKQ